MSNFHDYSLVRLFSRDRDQIVEHIWQLSDDDLYLRFGHPVKESHITKYVGTTTQESAIQDNFWWGILDEGKLIATIHVAARDDVAEFAFTTDANYRGQKLGQLLFARGYQLITERKITRIYMACLSQNAAIRHIAKKFGMSVMTYGSDAEASVTIQYPVPLSRLHEVKNCFIDKAIGK